MRMRLRLPAIVAACSRNKGWIFDSADRIRLRGCISVSPIRFFSSADLLKRPSGRCKCGEGRNAFAQAHSLGRSC